MSHCSSSTARRRPNRRSGHHKSDVDRRQQTNQHDGIKHEEQRIKALKVESRHCHEYEEASDDGISVITIVVGPDKPKNHPTESEHEYADQARHDVAVTAV